MPYNSICRAPDYGSQGEVRLPFEENGSSKVGVRFNNQIPGGIDLGGNCELDHGFFCSGASLSPKFLLGIMDDWIA
jgi:hypothetical protein